MGTRNISLPEDLAAYLEAKVSSGEYAHVSEVVRDGIRLLMREEAAKLEWLRNAIAVGMADYKAGRAIPADEVRAELARRRNARAEAKRRP